MVHALRLADRSGHELGRPELPAHVYGLTANEQDLLTELDALMGVDQRWDMTDPPGPHGSDILQPQALDLGSQARQDKIAAVHDGLHAGGMAPYGYRLVHELSHPRAAKASKGVRLGQFIPDDQEASIVRELFRRYLGHQGQAQLAADLNCRSVVPPAGAGETWTLSTITLILTNPRYVGYHFRRPVGVRSGLANPTDATYVRSRRRTHAALVPLADFVAVQKRRTADAKPRQSRRTSTGAIFFHRITCATCQRVMSVTSVPYGASRRINYRCRSNDHHRSNFNLAEPKLVKLVNEWLRTNKAVTSELPDPPSDAELSDIVHQFDLHLTYDKTTETVEISAGRGDGIELHARLALATM